MIFNEMEMKCVFYDRMIYLEYLFLKGKNYNVNRNK